MTGLVLSHIQLLPVNLHLERLVWSLETNSII